MKRSGFDFLCRVVGWLLIVFSVLGFVSCGLNVLMQVIGP